MQAKIYTSSGVILNPSIPRVGVTSRVSSEWLSDMWSNSVDLGYESMYADALEAADGDEDAAHREMECVETNGPFLIGDWHKNAAGMYEIDRNGPSGFAATYPPDTGNICVEWSKTTTRTHHTSPCYVMADGSGPCGDLDTPGDSVVAYTLPADAFYSEDAE